MDKRVLEGLEPVKVFEYFEDICGIAHGSGNVKEISDYCVAFAKAHQLWCRQDENYNVIIKKPGSAGSHNSPVIMQGHLDMVAVKTEDKVKDMMTEGLDLIVEDGFVRADRTTLGGDDGIAVAYILAVLDSDDMKHPPIEAVFTVDEEIGMLGAAALDCTVLKGNRMLNIDSEEEGVFLAGCAGGATIHGKHVAGIEKCRGEKVRIGVFGLTGGHSGTDIVYGRANANVLIGRILFSLMDSADFYIQDIHGGEKDNSIAVCASADVMVATSDMAQFECVLRKTADDLKAEYALTDPDMQITVQKEGEVLEEAFDKTSSALLISALTHIPDGVIRMSSHIDGLVQTSLNLGVVACSGHFIKMTYLIRSSVESEKEYLIQKVRDAIIMFGGTCMVTGRYPAWEYREDSKLRQMMCDAYEALYHARPEIQAIHAGVECGIFAGEIQNLDCVSFGPDIKDIHTVRERLDIGSVQRTWELIKEVLCRCAETELP